MQTADVLIGYDHGMSRGVRISIQDDEVVPGAMDNQRFPIIVAALQVTEDAGRRFGGRSEVGIAPWSPEIVHKRAEYQTHWRCPNGACMLSRKAVIQLT